MSFDSALFLSINGTSMSPYWLTAVALFSTKHLPELMAGGAIGVFFVGDRAVKRRVMQVFVAMAIAWLLARLGQHLISIDRPFVVGIGKQWLPHAASHGFPSTHASVIFGFSTAVALTAGRWYWALLAIAAAALVAWSRIYLGLHFPSDVLAGACVGMASAWLACRLIPLLAMRRTFISGIA